MVDLLVDHLYPVLLLADVEHAHSVVIREPSDVQSCQAEAKELKDMSDVV